MPVRKKVAKKKVAKKRAAKGTALKTMSDWEKRMAEAAAQQSQLEQAGSGNIISTRGGKFSYQGTTIGRTMDVVILGFSHTRAWYDSDFDPDGLQSPACFAVSLDGNEEEPHETSPNRQADVCSECDFDVWGSSDRGDGKACRQHRRLVVMSWQEQLEESDIAQVSVPPASLKNWKGYIRKVQKQLHRPCYGVATRLSFDEDAEYPVMEFELIEQINNPTDMETIFIAAEGEEVADMLIAPMDVSNYEEPQPKKRSKKRASKKKAARRRY